MTDYSIGIIKNLFIKYISGKQLHFIPHIQILRFLPPTQIGHFEAEICNFLHIQTPNKDVEVSSWFTSLLLIRSQNIINPPTASLKCEYLTYSSDWQGFLISRVQTVTLTDGYTHNIFIF